MAGSSSRKEVVILSASGEQCPETLLLRGALWYCGVTGRVASEPPDVNETLLCVDLSLKQRFPGVVVRVGRLVTREHCRAAMAAGPDEILIYGEPYELIQDFACDIELVREARGQALLGSLFDVRRYRSPPLEPRTDHAYILTSLGCEKKCGYCSHGANCSSLYGSCFSRRSRPWQDVYDELAASKATGIDDIFIVADQFLSANPEENEEIKKLAAAWSASEGGKLRLHFTVSPREVLNNRPLLDTLSRSFSLHPRLSIESFDDATLALLDLDFDSAQALEAFRALASLQAPLRVNYLLIRPGATVRALKQEFASFLTIARAVPYMNPIDRLLLAHDLFSGRLRLLPGSPIAGKVVSGDCEKAVPAQVFTIVSKVQASLEAQACKANVPYHIERDCDPLLAVLDVAFKEVA